MPNFTTPTARFRARLVDAAGIDPTRLSPQAQRTLRWMTDWDEPTITGLEEILQTVRSAACCCEGGRR